MRVLTFILSMLIATNSQAADEPIPLNTILADQMSSEAFTAFRTIEYQISLNGLKKGIEEPDLIEQVGTPVVMDETTVSYIEDIVSDDLMDPYSAVFSDHRAIAFGKDHGALLACGWVNAKNGFGGYVGKRAFIVSLSNPHLDGELQSTSEFDEVWVYESCLSLGLLER